MSPKVAIYLDANSAARPGPSVLETLRHALTEPLALYSNPSSEHQFGKQAERVLSSARATLASKLGPTYDSAGVVFTSNGTEAIQSALFSSRVAHLITSPIEHSATRAVQSKFETLRMLSVSSAGVLTWPDSLQPAPSGTMLSFLALHNETGVIQPVESLCLRARSMGVPVHIDACQWIGKVSRALPDADLVDWISISGAKLGAGFGIGAIWVNPRHREQFTSQLRGLQQGGKRGGTEPVLGASLLSAALTECLPDVVEEKLRPLRDHFESTLLTRVPSARIVGAEAERVAQTSLIVFEGSRSSPLAFLDLNGIACSRGSACTAGVSEPSASLLAMGVDRALARTSLRVSLDRYSTQEELERVVDVLENWARDRVEPS
jgi:cysteine desulfurase